MMLTYNEFKEFVKRELGQLLGEDYKVVEDKMVKNNDVVLDALVVMRKNPDVAPVIYVQELYEKYLEGECLKVMITTLVESMKVHSQIDVSIFEKEFFEIRELIVMGLVNKEWNQKKLKDVVYLDFLDLAVIFKVNLYSATHESCTCTISRKLLEHWGITEELLVQTAWENLQKEKVVLRDVFAFIEMKEDEFMDEEQNLYVLTNEEKVNGAVMILRKDVLGEYADKIGKNLYILPSSVHECMICADDGTHEAKELQAMVTEINETQVDPRERLSNSVYYYDKKVGSVRRIC